MLLAESIVGDTSMKYQASTNDIKPGDKFNQLTFIEHLDPIIYHGRLRRLCSVACDCGNKFELLNSYLVRGVTKRCSECFKKWNQSKKGPRLGLGICHKKRIYEVYENRAISKNIDFSLPFEDFIHLIDQKCCYCGTEKSCCKKVQGSDFHYYYNTLDRFDNAKGYTLENSKPCCIRCNCAKGKNSFPEFKFHINSIYARCCDYNKIFERNGNLVYGEHLYLKYIAKCNYYKYNFDLNIDEFNEATSKNCYYCGQYPKNTWQLWKENYGKIVKYNGLTRINNQKGFINNNIRPSCYKCSRFKNDMDEIDFIQWIKQVYITMFPYG